MNTTTAAAVRYQPFTRKLRTRDIMRKQISYSICAILLLAGFFGICAVSESSLSLWEGLGVIFGISVAEAPVIMVANKMVKEERA